MSDPWLVVIDPQRIFADPASDWGSPMWRNALRVIEDLLPHFAERTIVTRWLPPPPADRVGSWDAYMKAWPFADRPSTDSRFDLVDELARVPTRRADAPTFGKWGVLAPIVGAAPHLVVTGVSTDCCVISTVLPAADAGATITLVSDGCAGSTAENHAAAVQVMGLYPPQVTVLTAAQVLGH